MAMRIKMLRNLAHKPGKPEKDQRYEGQEYTVNSKEARDLVRQGLAIDLDAPPTVPEEEEEREEEETVADDLDEKKLAELKELAVAEGVTLTSTKRADVIAEIRAARSAKTDV